MSKPNDPSTFCCRCKMAHDYCRCPPSVLPAAAAARGENGQLVETAWSVYRRRVLPASLTEAQLVELRQAYFSGAATLFHLINATLDDGDEPSDRDLLRMAGIEHELGQFGAELDRRMFSGRTKQ